MSLTYSPAHPGAYNSVWGPVFLASRDITGQVPINKVEYPGVNVQAVCSPDNVFGRDQYRTCLSDLLGAQFRWFLFDIYWDYTNSQFGLCPVQVPSQDSNATSDEVVTAVTSLRRATINGSEADASSDDLLQLGLYQCSDGLTFDSVLDLFHNYFSATSSKVLGRVVHDELQPYVYPFSQLLSDRGNLNGSWYAPDDPHAMKSTGYFNTSMTTNSTNSDVLSTPDGWPSELYLLFSKFSRLLVTWGTVDDQMAAYDFASDASTVFPRDYMSTPHTFQADATTGALSSGCFYDDTTTSASRVNVSWSLGYTDASPNATADSPAHELVGNLTACGISPILNTSNSSSLPRSQLHGPARQFRCAVIDSSAAYTGRWRVANCQQSFVAACRVNAEPFRWRLTPNAVTFHDAPRACQTAAESDTETVLAFDQPHTGLENTYLHHYLLNNQSGLSSSSSSSSPPTTAAWINLNSLSAEGCWVTTGPNGTCEYTNDLDLVNDRRILIPTIGALIILILALLTALAKCNSNYRHNRKTKTGPGGWEYEGVPS
ncbi:hypothetical protein DV735_g4641, partial [Chaetothyriales sp. CBS 134920]